MLLSDPTAAVSWFVCGFFLVWVVVLLFRELASMLHGGREKLEAKLRLRREIESDPVFDKSNDYFMSREEK